MHLFDIVYVFSAYISGCDALILNTMALLLVYSKITFPQLTSIEFPTHSAFIGIYQIHVSLLFCQLFECEFLFVRAGHCNQDISARFFADSIEISILKIKFQYEITTVANIEYKRLDNGLTLVGNFRH